MIDGKLSNHFISFQLGESTEEIAVLHVYFKQLGIIQYIRDELYSIIDFIGNHN